MKISEAPPPGWYPDPEGTSRLRWWEGTDWSDRYRSRPVGAVAVGHVASAQARPASGDARWSGPGPVPPVDTQAVVNQVRMAAREEAERAAMLFGQQARAATRSITPLITQYTSRITRWFRILAVLAILLLVGWLAFQLFAQASLFEWIGDRIDQLTNNTKSG